MAKNFALRLLSLALVLTCILALCTSTAFAEDHPTKKGPSVSRRIVILGLEDDDFKTCARLIRDKSPDSISIMITCDPDYDNTYGDNSWLVVCNNEDGSGEYEFEGKLPENIVFVNSFFADTSSLDDEYEEYYQYENRLARMWAYNLMHLAKGGATIHLYVSESDNMSDVITRIAIAYLDMYSRTDFFGIEKNYNVFRVYGLFVLGGSIVVHRVDHEIEALPAAIHNLISDLWAEN